MKKISGAIDEVRNAVKQLRLALGETQQQFAHRLQMAISTVVRYELSRAPRGPALAKFGRLAEESGRHDLSVIFHDALSKELGEPSESASDPIDATWLQAIKIIRDQDSDTWKGIGKTISAALQAIIKKESDPIRFNQLETIMVLVRKSLAPSGKEIEKLARLLMAKRPGLNLGDATREIISSNPELYEKSLAEDFDAARGTQFESGSSYHGRKGSAETDPARAPQKRAEQRKRPSPNTPY